MADSTSGPGASAPWWKPATWRAAFAQVPRTARIVLDADRLSAVGIVALGFIAAGLPLAVAWIGKLIIDGVLEAVDSGDPQHQQRVLLLVGAELVLMLTMALTGRGAGLLRSVLGARLGYHIQLLILRKASALQLSDFENPAVYDRLQNARREATARPLNVFVNTTGLVKDTITLVSYGAVLAVFSPWAVLLLLCATVPSLVAATRLSGEAFRLFSWRAPEGRRMRYLSWLLTRDNSIKEVKLYGLADTLLEQYREIYVRFFGEERALAVKRAVYGFALGAVSSAALYGCYAWIVVRTIAGVLTVGEMTMYLTIFRQGQACLRSILGSLGSTYEDNLFMSNLFGFLDLPERAPVSLRDEDEAPPDDEAGFRLEGVSFRYPGQKEWALRGIDLEIGPTDKIAIIGDNGAGKSTLIKLLTGLYPPTEGRVLLGGRPLAEYDEERLRARVGVVLQDYVRYQFSAADNVGLGRVERRDDRAAIQEAARRGGGDAVVESLPDGWDTQLGRWFESGVELSSGQWQKLAVSRAFMRDAEILILDEPTASLDAEAEFELFERFRQLTEGRMAILISHRFSTVRMADRIIVLREGRVEEIGSHEELLALGGRYAHLFKLQAQGYLDAFA